MDLIQRSLVLIGNAVNYVSLVRRNHIIYHMSRNNSGLAQAMRSVCKKHQPEEDLLFGSAVHKTLAEKAETISSLKKVAEKVDQSCSKKPSDKK